jgi:hypothetical protein
MRKAGVRAGHVWRCVVYSYDLTFWAGLLLTALIVLNVLDDAARYAVFREWNLPQIALNVTVLLLPAVWIVATFRLCFAYQRYLRFKHAWAMVISAQVMLALFLFLVAFFLRSILIRD